MNGSHVLPARWSADDILGNDLLVQLLGDGLASVPQSHLIHKSGQPRVKETVNEAGAGPADRGVAIVDSRGFGADQPHRVLAAMHLVSLGLTWEWGGERGRET